MGQGCLGVAASEHPCWCSELATYPSFLKASLVTLRCSAFKTHSKNRVIVCVCSFLVTSTVLVSLRGHSASHFSVALVAFRLTCLSIWQALGAQQRIPLAGGTTTTPGALEQTLWTFFLGIFLESVVLLFACELRHESIFTTTFPSI